MTSTFIVRYFNPNIFLLVVIISITIAFIRHPMYTKYACTNIINEEISLHDLLVTPTRPARTDNTLDYARCAALHNKLVEYAWAAEGREINDLERHSFFHHYGEQANEIRRRLDPALVAFLESIILADELPPFFFWVEGISPPEFMFASDDILHHDALSEPGRFLILYNTNPGLVGHAMGLIYDQQLHCATMALGVEDIDFTRPVERHRHLWYSLETILSNWWHMVQIGKITASQDSAPNEKHGPWIWHSYSPMQVVSAIASFERLVKAIETRISPDKLLPISNKPLFSHTDLDKASVPNPCFIRSFLSGVRRPRFDRIAPGLAIPHNPTIFAANQRYTVMNISSKHGTIIPPVLIFASAEKRIVSLISANSYVSFNPFCRAFSKDIPSDGQSILSGLYSESVERFSGDNAEEGFRLLLPFPLRALGEEHGARKSDMNLVEEKSVADLFQHGFKPFGGEWWRAQRLEMLFDAWTHLVESGVWKVGDNGIDGNIDMFKDADRGQWADYRIDPSW
ncbi:hypothetical protein F5Y00DRAFT_16984 [Daldinia vernicosa]|uniref:uncharacterized protein n=1 Tax=Daldinia vernicosa TaxID=114800 RepID=UPI002008AEB8|nr:uncharacterized protein F5Y00DRAFT_16984 [Daldinia vernicosa]KAI0851204.1 hypothetical protein F5Y00DRAFT_16984 [Daldinia vernicosa]